MASSGSGLTRRRGVAGGSTSNLEGEDGSRVSSPVPRRNEDNRGPETSYEDSENGHRIAFDPRDISESAERNKQPKLTLMEEVLLMGLKDKQVGFSDCRLEGIRAYIGYHRAICRFGMIISRTHCAAA